MTSALYKLLADLSHAVETRNPLTAMGEISRVLRVHLDPAWAEYSTIESTIYDLQREIEQLKEAAYHDYRKQLAPFSSDHQ